MDKNQYEDEIELKEYFAVLQKNWQIIVSSVIIFVLLAFVISKLQPPVYEASTTILLRGSSTGLSSQYAGVAGVLGINLPSGGGGNLGDITELLKSKIIAGKVLDDLKLSTRIKGWDNPKLTRQQLVLMTKGMLRPTKMVGNVVEIKVESNDPQLSADVANGYISALGYYWNESNYTEAQKKLRYIEAELPKAEGHLNLAENKMKLIPRSSYGLASISGQGKLQRDYDIYNSVYVMLKKELESTKLEASKEIPPFSIIDQAEKPLFKIKPKVKSNLIVGAVLGLFIGIFASFFKEYWEKSEQ